jgi:integrase
METTLTIVPEHGALTRRLSERARNYVSAARADNTRRAYQSAWSEFQQWCAARKLSALPATPEALADYLTCLADGGRRVSTIQQKFSAISLAHETADVPNPTKAESVKLTMQGIRRKLGCASQQKAPVTRGELSRMISTLSDDLAGKRDKAILLVGFAGAFRRGELVGLNVEDVRFGAADLTINLRRSKTDQEGHGAVKRIPMLDNPTLCPVRALKDWLDAAQIKSGALFRAIDRWGHARRDRLNDRAIALIVKRAAKAAGLDTRQFAGHSLRAGFVTQAANDQTPEWAIAEVTGHKSRAVLQRYIRDAGRGQLTAIRRAFGETCAEPQG